MRADLGWRFELCRVGLIMLKPAIALAIVVEEKIETDSYYLGLVLESY